MFDRDIINGPTQHGFLPGTSTITANLTIQDYVGCNLDMGKIVLMYSADLSAAFDMLRPDVLIKICRKKGFPEVINRVIFDYLTNRSGYVEIDGQSSILKHIPIGCVQGSVIGPRLFNIYTSEFDSIIGPDFFKISYADDSYVAISCQPSQYMSHKLRLEETIRQHFNWLKSIGMIVNPNKTEFIVFHPRRLESTLLDPLLIDNCKIFPTKNLKILGLNFSPTLDWETHIDKTINKANSMIYAFRYLNSRISRARFATLLHAHFLSKLTFACQVWSGSLSSTQRRRIDSCFFKMIRLLCRDFRGKISRAKLISDSGMRSLRSTFIERDAKLLHKICTELKPEPLVERLLSQCYIQARRENRLFFYDYSYKKVGRTSFINRAKYIAELIPFEWLNLNEVSFHNKMKSTIPPYMKLN
jgi:hypothetical protein